MNPNYTEFRFPQIKANPWSKIFRGRNATPEAIDLLSKMLDYVPQTRIDAFSCLIHPFFDELREPDTKLPNGNDLPPLFNFSEQGQITFSCL